MVRLGYYAPDIKQVDDLLFILLISLNNNKEEKRKESRTKVE